MVLSFWLREVRGFLVLALGFQLCAVGVVSGGENDLAARLSVLPAADLEAADPVLIKRFESASDAPSSQTLPYGQTDRVTVTGGQLRLLSDGELYFDLRLTGSAYATRLRENAGRVTWAFNVTRSHPGNRFTVALAGGQTQLKTPGGYGYYVEGTSDSGTIVLRRFALQQYRNTQPRDLVTVPDLLPAGVAGSFRVTYDPATEQWAFYGGPADSGADPMQESRFLGGAVDSDGTGADIMTTGRGLNYLAFQSTGTGSASFDNLTVTAVTRPNRPPVVQDDLDMSGAMYLDMWDMPYYYYFPLWNDSDPDGDTLETVSISPLQHGSGYVQSFGLEYFPSVSCPGEDLTFLVSDGHGGLASEHVTFGPPQKKVYGQPEPLADNFVVPAKGATVLDVLRNDYNPDGVPVRVIFAPGVPVPAGVEIQPNGTLLYTPSEFESPQGLEFEYQLDSPISRSMPARVRIVSPLRGVFTGTLAKTSDDSAPDPRRISGDVRVVLNESGSFSGSVRVLGESISLKGTLDAGHEAYLTVTLSNGQNAAVTLDADPFDSRRAVVFGVTIADEGYIGTLHTERRATARGLTGQFNVLLPGDDHPVGEPRGTGYGVMRVSSSGTIRLVGKMPDGASFSCAAELLPHGVFSLYSSLRRAGGKAAGQVAGRIRFLQRPGISDCEGALSWHRSNAVLQPGERNTWLVQRMIGSRFFSQPSASSVSGLPVRAKNVALSLSGGAMTAEIFSRVSIVGTEVHQDGGDAALHARAVIQPRNGLWSGSFRDPETGASTTFSGVVFPSQQAAGGLFLQEGRGGAAVLRVPRP